MTAAALLVLVTATGARPALSVEQYREQLHRLEARLDSGDARGAAELGRTLRAEEVHWAGGVLRPDPRVLDPIVDGHGQDVREALAVLSTQLGDGGASREPASADAEKLSALARAQQTSEIRWGKGIPDAPEIRLSVAQTVRRWLASAWDWVVGRLKTIFRWLRSWWRTPERPESPASGGTAIQTPVLLIVLAVVVLMVALGWLVLRTQRVAPPSEAPRRAPDVEDADPLQRDVGSWQSRARALAAEGRHREAIRAWYHAVLVSCFHAGALHHRPGTTNREYASRLGPDLAWRADFADLTTRFDIEWYGRSESTPEAHQRFAGDALQLLPRIPRRVAA
jgi:hypothetical protein